MSQVSTKEPLFHIVKREGVTCVRASLIRLVAILLALVVCAFVIMGMTGMNPLSVYAGIWSGAVGTARRTWVTLRDSAILLCIGFAVLPAFRMLSLIHISIRRRRTTTSPPFTSSTKTVLFTALST